MNSLLHLAGTGGKSIPPEMYTFSPYDVNDQAVGTGTLSSAAEMNTIPSVQVLNNQELTNLILEHFDAIFNPHAEDLIERSLRAVGRLVTVNRAFFHACTDIIWSGVPSMKPFLLLLPPCNSRDAFMPRLKDGPRNDNPWSRFQFYGERTTSLMLDTCDLRQDYPIHWFFLLHNHPSRPFHMFPKLRRLEILSLRGINALIPFQSMPNLCEVIIHQLEGSRIGDERAPTKDIVTSMVMFIASNNATLKKFWSGADLPQKTVSLLPRISSLSEVKLTLPMLSALEDSLSALADLPQLRDLTLTSSQGHSSLSDDELIAQLLEGGNSPDHYADNGQMKLNSLCIESDGFSLFRATTSLARRRLDVRRFIGSISRAIPLDSFDDRDWDPFVSGVLLIPHLLQLLAHRIPTVRDILLDWEHPPMETLSDDLTADARAQIPDDLFDSFSKFQSLRILSISNIPFTTPDFTVRLVEVLPDLPRLRSLCLIPLAIPDREPTHLILPTLQCLRPFATRKSPIRHITMALDFSVPIPTPEESTSTPSHDDPVPGLKWLFIEPMNRRADLQETERVALARYLDGLFPRLQHLTPHDEKNRLNILPRVPTLHSTSLVLWRKVDRLIKSFQRERKEEAVLVDTT